MGPSSDNYPIFLVTCVFGVFFASLAILSQLILFNQYHLRNYFVRNNFVTFLEHYPHVKTLFSLLFSGRSQAKSVTCFLLVVYKLYISWLLLQIPILHDGSSTLRYLEITHHR